jgi:hypothetical protein
MGGGGQQAAVHGTLALAKAGGGSGVLGKEMTPEWASWAAGAGGSDALVGQ